MDLRCAIPCFKDRLDAARHGSANALDLRFMICTNSPAVHKAACDCGRANGFWVPRRRSNNRQQISALCSKLSIGEVPHTPEKIEFHLNNGQTSSVKLRRGHGGDTVAFPKAPRVYKG